MRSISILLATAFVFIMQATDADARPRPTAPAAGNRRLDCIMGRAVDLDPHRMQDASEVRYEGAFPFALFLPARPARYTPTPSPTDDPEPVDPATRILDDPAKLAADMQVPFRRVVDLWPERVEMIAEIPGTSLLRLFVISEIDSRQGTAQLFMTRAADAASLDLENVYQGACRVSSSASH